MVGTAILGTTGYTGQETLDRVLAHPQLDVVALGSDSLAGLPAAALDVRLNGDLPPFITNQEALEAGAELVFLCLPHEEAAAVEPPSGATVVDLSGGHRLSAELYPAWYGWEHPRPGELEGWCYALPELWPPDSALVASPGCYATAALLALGPLAHAVDRAGVVVDAKSGVSGAGRGLAASSHAGFVLENVSAYAIGSHRHTPEIAAALGFPVCFVPHVVPVRRGLLVTCYARAIDDTLRERLEEAYGDSQVVRLLSAGVAPELGRVQGCDAAEIALYEDRATGTAIVICALDNLGKGAAGQAVQNANLALGFEETAGLRLAGVLV